MATRAFVLAMVLVSGALISPSVGAHANTPPRADGLWVGSVGDMTLGESLIAQAAVDPGLIEESIELLGVQGDSSIERSDAYQAVATLAQLKDDGSLRDELRREMFLAHGFVYRTAQQGPVLHASDVEMSAQGSLESGSTGGESVSLSGDGDAFAMDTRWANEFPTTGGAEGNRTSWTGNPFTILVGRFCNISGCSDDVFRVRATLYPTLTGGSNKVSISTIYSPNRGYLTAKHVDGYSFIDGRSSESVYLGSVESSPQIFYIPNWYPVDRQQKLGLLTWGRLPNGAWVGGLNGTGICSETRKSSRACYYSLPGDVTDNVLNDGEVLGPGGILQSPNGVYTLSMQGDGNLVLYRYGNARWGTGTAGNSGAYLVFQEDGNLVLYTAGGRVLWATATFGADHLLAVQNDGNLVIYNGYEQVRWSLN